MIRGVVPAGEVFRDRVIRGLVLHKVSDVKLVGMEMEMGLSYGSPYRGKHGG